MFDADLPSDGFCRVCIVSSEHNYIYIMLKQVVNGLFGRGFNLIGDAKVAK
ncbi:hypothetical protein D3C81_882610 [compost metagenome]